MRASAVNTAAAGWLNAMAFAGTERRDLRFDFLRGFAVLAMVVDHIGGPSPLYQLTGGNRFFTSAAEGFVLLSGIVAGLVHGRIAERESIGVAQRRLLSRAWTLYVLTLGLTIVALSFGLAGSSGGAQVAQQTPVELLWSIVTLHQTAYLVDVPLLYTLLLLIAPLALLLMHAGRTWIVIVASFVLWTGYQVLPAQTDLPWPIAGNTLFHFPAWQILFFLGMVLGYHRENLRAAVSGARQWAFLAASAVAFAGLLIGFRWLQFGLDTSPYAGATLALELQERVFAKSDLQIGRLVASAIVFGFLFVGITRFWVPLRAGLGWLLLPLGQHSLYAYTAHIALALALPLVTERMHLTVSQSPNLSALVQVSSLALIWLAIRFRLLYPTGEMRRWSMLAPVPLAVFMLVTVAREPVPTLVGPAPEAAPASSDATRLARVFGTPVTRQLLQSAAASAPPAPATVPERKVAPSSTPLRAPAVSLHIPSSAGATVNPSSFASAIQARIEGSFLELSFHSAVLDREMSYYAYLPPHYEAAAQRYSVLYMLHGASGNKDEWPSYGLVETVDRLISRAEISPVVVVLPQGDDGYWVNQANNGPRWGDYVTQDVISSVDGTFRTFADADHRAVGGLSMGGAGALQLALNHPNLFRSVGAHSPSLHVDDDTFPILGTGFEFATREPMKLAADAPGIDGLDIWMDAGEQDPWLERDTLLHETLAERGIPHHWSVLEGGHEGPYWQHNLETYVRFYDASLARLGSPGRDAGWSNAGDIPFR